MKGKGTFVKELLDKTIKDLVLLRRKLREELYRLKMKHAIRGLKETHTIKELRKKIAKVSTVLTSKIADNNGSSMK